MNYWLIVFAITTVAWLALMLYNQAVIRVMGRKWWYRNIYLMSLHWRLVSRFRRRLGGNRCDKRGAGEHFGALQVHHAPWAYRWLYWEWLPWVMLFGLRVLCARHHRLEHR